MTNNNKRRKKMKTVKAETNSTSFINIVGGLLIAFAVIDFAMSFAGTNLTSFLGPVSRFSPIIFGLIGSALLNVGKEGS
jgi:hypothetical protein|tara:strand:- start:93 stop:329 length:237 start_codon:yes stop_codon:yes gene_type:complete